VYDMTIMFPWGTIALGVGVFAATLILNLAAVGVVLLILPPTYLADDHVHDDGVARAIARNVIGVVLVALGIVTSLPGVPGQGLLTIAIGVLLTDVPGKRRLARLIVCRAGMLERINRFRRRFGIAPLVLTCAAP
jgi:hypothetical protein